MFGQTLIMDDATLSLIINPVIEEEKWEEKIINLMMSDKKRKTHDIFTNLSIEGTLENLITRHLIDDWIKCQHYSQLTKEYFDFVLSAICEEITTVSTNLVKYPI